MLIVKVTEVHQLEKGSKFVLSFPHPKAGFTIMLPDPSPIYKHSSIHLSIYLNTHALIYSFIYSFTEQCIEHPLCAKVTRESGETGERAFVLISARDDADLADQREKQRWRE